jgi:hypothetical protein
MNTRTIALLSLLVASLAGCRARPVARKPEVPPFAPVFGPIVGNEVIAGRADDEEGVWLLVGGEALVHVNLASRAVRRVNLKLPAGEHCWGLARLQDGTLWTLRGRRAVIQIDAEGAIVRDMPLSESHLGLFGVADRLVYQTAAFTPPGPALRAGAPGAAATTPWSDMTTRTFDRINRASAVALNLVGCGGTSGQEHPCWFPDEAAVSLIRTAGGTRRLALAGLDVVAPEILLTAENPPRPVRDAYVDGDGHIWVLSSGTPPPGAVEQPGGWILARYGSRGEPMDLRRLAESARLILRAGVGRAVLLTGAGMVAEVVP